MKILCHLMQQYRHFMVCVVENVESMVSVIASSNSVWLCFYPVVTYTIGFAI